MKKKFHSFLSQTPFSAAAAGHSRLKHALSHVLGNMTWWQILLIIAGIMAILGIIMVLFFSFGDSAKYEWASEIHPVDSEEFLQAIARVSNSPIEQGDGIKILNNGDEFMPAFLDAIKNAKQTININVYIWEKGDMSDQIFAALLERARAGVEVRILLDGFGGHKAPQDEMDQLQKAGAQIEKFRTAKFGKLSRVYRRDHRRAIVIDGKVGFTGGMAFADQWLGHAQDPKHWRDTMFEVNGTMAQSLQAAFAELWAGAHGEILEGTKFYPPVTASGNASSRYVNVISSPASDAQPLPKFFWLSIASAQKTVYLNSPYLVPDPHIRQALMDRAKAGVDVRLLVPNKYNDAKPIRLASQNYYQELLEAGVKIYEYQPTMIHSKILIVDGQWSVIGSANMDIRSVQLNEENVMGIVDSNFAQELQNVFMDNLKQAQQINLVDWKKRGIFQRIGEKLFVNFAKQY